MLFAITSPSVCKHVVTLSLRPCCASPLLHTLARITSQTNTCRSQAFSTTAHLHKTKPTNSESIEVFLPHEQLKIKASNTIPFTTTTTTSLITSHHDLTSYIRHQNVRLRSELDATKRSKLGQTTVFLGTRYEYLIQRHLQDHFGFSLTRIGGKGDGGVDLIGTWTLPDPLSTSSAVHSPSSPSSSSCTTIKPTFKVLMQAKRLAAHRKPMPALMRELEGTLISASSSRPLQEAFAAHQIRTETTERARTTLTSSRTEVEAEIGLVDVSISASTHLGSTWASPYADDLKKSNAADQNPPTLAILVTTRPLTEGIEKAMASSRRCLMYICLDESSVSNGNEDLKRFAEHVPPTTTVRQITWNAAAAQAGLEGYNVITKYRQAKENEGLTGEAVMAYQGRPLQFRPRA